MINVGCSAPHCAAAEIQITGQTGAGNQHDFPASESSRREIIIVKRWYITTSDDDERERQHGKVLQKRALCYFFQAYQIISPDTDLDHGETFQRLLIKTDSEVVT